MGKLSFVQGYVSGLFKSACNMKIPYALLISVIFYYE